MNGKDVKRGLHLRTMRTLTDLLKPLKVKSLVITRADKYKVRGIVLTECPIERRESRKDFEVKLIVDDGGSVASVSVDGRKLFPLKLRLRRARHGHGWR